MKIQIDIGHPAHVHYFKNFIWLMQSKGHEFVITARNKEVTLELLNNYGFSYVERGKGAHNYFGKIFYSIKIVYIIYLVGIKFKPDILISFASPYMAIVSKLINKPHITFTDTEHTKFEQKFFIPFSKTILTPSCFTKDIGSKQLRFNGYMELCYLHQNHFNPNNEVLEELNLKENEKYIIVRFVSWNASHDIGQTGLSYDFKIKLIEELKDYGKIFISSERELPDELKQYQIKIKPESLHSVLNYATLYIGEGATTASECAAIGTPAIYVNSLNAGTLNEQQEYGLLFGFRNSIGVLEKAKEILQIPNYKEEIKTNHQKMINDKIDVTSFMVWFVENYPKSAIIMKENPEYQERFR